MCFLVYLFICLIVYFLFVYLFVFVIVRCWYWSYRENVWSTRRNYCVPTVMGRASYRGKYKRYYRCKIVQCPANERKEERWIIPVQSRLYKPAGLYGAFWHVLCISANRRSSILWTSMKIYKLFQRYRVRTLYTPYANRNCNVEFRVVGNACARPWHHWLM